MKPEQLASTDDLPRPFAVDPLPAVRPLFAGDKGHGAALLAAGGA